MSTKKKTASEEEVLAEEPTGIVASEEQEEANEEVAVELMDLAMYVLNRQPNPGLVASFKAEKLNDTVTPRSLTQWDNDFNVQANRVYK